jgi:hypothetical protein
MRATVIAALAGVLLLTPAAPADDANLREAVGTFAGLNLYQTYLNIGLIADAKAEGVYEEKQARELLDSVLKPVDDLSARLARLARDAPKEDREGMEECRRLYGLLQKQGKALQAVWSSGKKEDAEAYDVARKQAWEGISKLLKLDEP